MVGTSHSGAVAYDLPGSANARIFWGTGRGSYLRNGLAPAAPPTLALSAVDAGRAIAAGQSASYTLVVGGTNAPTSLSAGAVSGPAPLPTLTLSTTSLSGPGQATLTLADQHAAGPLLPGTAYHVAVTATRGSLTRQVTLTLIVGGARGYLPIVRR